MTKIHRAPRVLTVDDGEKFDRRGKQCDYSFIFSDNVEDWQCSPNMRHKRRIGRIVMKKYWERKGGKDVLPEETND